MKCAINNAKIAVRVMPVMHLCGLLHSPPKPKNTHFWLKIEKQRIYRTQSEFYLRDLLIYCFIQDETQRQKSSARVTAVWKIKPWPEQSHGHPFIHELLVAHAKDNFLCTKIEKPLL